MGRIVSWTLAAVAVGLALPGAARPAPPVLPPLDPQQVQDQQDMTWNDYKPIPRSTGRATAPCPRIRASRSRSSRSTSPISRS